MTMSAPRESVWLRPPTVIAVVLAMAALKAVVAARIELAFDEGYYTFWSFALQPGYLDHPPAVAWMIAAGRAILGDTELGARLFAVLSGVAISAMIYRIGILLLDRRTAALATIWYNLTLAFGLGFLITPDPPAALFWVAVLWAMAEFMDGRSANWLLVGGLFAGLGLWSKYTTAFLLIGLFLFVIVSRERRHWFGLWQLWAAPVVALAVFAPVILWNAQRGWASFGFQGKRTSVSGLSPDMLSHFAEMLAGQAIFVVPILFLFTVAGLVLYARRPLDEDRAGLALPVLTSLPALAYFLFHATHSRVEANWLWPLWSGLTLVGAWAAVHIRPQGGWQAATLRVARALQAPIGVIMVAVVFAQFLYQPVTWLSFDRTQETRGWRPLAAQIEALAAARGARWIVAQTNYPSSGEIATYLRFTGSDLPYYSLLERERYEFLPPADAGALGWPALMVRHAGMASGLADWFGRVEFLETVTRRFGAETMESYDVYLVSDPSPDLLNLLSAPVR